MECDNCHREVAAVFSRHAEDGTKLRSLCGDCVGRLYPEETIRKMMPGWWRTKKEQEAINKKVAEKLWLRLVDLPGYAEWAAQYQGLERIISNLSDYHLLVHPDEMNGPMDWFFEQTFQTQLEATANTMADYGVQVRRQNLNEFRKTT
jgi:hypothetical protein